jgi:rod shape-determining protein MreC
MAILEIRQRNGWLFVAVVVGHLVLISSQAKTDRGVSILESVVFGMFAEVQRAATSGVGTVQDTWQNYFALQQIRRENEALKEEVAKLRIGLQQEQNVASQARALQDLLHLRQDLPVRTTAARVIGGGASTEFQSITIDKGTQDGLAHNMAVIAPSGVVGRVVQPTLRAAKVQLLIDAAAAAGAIVERSRVQGVVTGSDGGLKLEYLGPNADIKVGDTLVTSGVDGIFPSPIDPEPINGQYPKGFVIGQIESIQRGGGKFTNVTVRPAVDFTSLETVLVVLDRPSADATAATAGTSGVKGNEAR